MTMTADKMKLEEPQCTPIEGEDVTPKQDGGVLKVCFVHCRFQA